MKGRSDQYKTGITSEGATDKRIEATVRIRKDRSAQKLADARRELAMAQMQQNVTGITDIDDARSACISIQNIFGSASPTEQDLTRACGHLLRLFVACRMPPHMPEHSVAMRAIVETKMPPFAMVVSRLIRVVLTSAREPDRLEQALRALMQAGEMKVYGNEQVTELAVGMMVSNKALMDCIITHLPNNPDNTARTRMVGLLAVCCGKEATHLADLFILSSYSRDLHNAFCNAWMEFLHIKHTEGLYACTWLAHLIFWHHSESSLTIEMLTTTLWGLVKRMVSQIELASLADDANARQIAADLMYCVASMAQRGSVGTKLVLSEADLMDMIFALFQSEIDPRALQHPIVELYFVISCDRPSFEGVLVPHRTFPLIVEEMHKRCLTAYTKTAVIGWSFFAHLASIGTPAVRLMLEKYVLHSAVRVLISGGSSEGHTAAIVFECSRVLYRCLETLYVQNELKTAVPIMQQKGVDFVRAFGTQLTQQCEDQRAIVCIRGLALYCGAIPEQQRPATREILQSLPELEDVVNAFYHMSESSMSIPATELLNSLKLFEMDCDEDEYEMKTDFKF
jgi:hypothetical protein